MSQNILNVSSNQPFAPIENARAIGAQPSVADVSDKTLSEIYAEYKKHFIDTTVKPGSKYPTGTSYPDLLKGACYRLGSIISVKTTDTYGDDFSKLPEIYNHARMLYPDNKAVDGICREGYMALRFYVKSIVDYLEMLNTYIQEAQTALEKLQEIMDMPDIDKDEKLQLAREHIDKLSVCKRFADETVDALVKRYQYNNDTKQWEIVGDEKDMLYEGDDIHSQIATMTSYKSLEALRTTPIKYKDSDKMKEAPIMVFGSLSLIDRMKFIYYYYKLIGRGYTDYTNFPDDIETGYPCIPDVESKKDTEATKHLGAMEMFYVGYLTDRDGPINAVSSFFEVKVQALRENLNIQSKSISALNTYLEFINRGLNILNSSQSGTDGKDIKHRIPDGAATALTYLCGGSMYNFYEEDDKKYLVLQSNRKDRSNYCFLIPADESGMRFLIGNNGTDRDGRGNNFCDNYDLDETGVFTATFIDTKDPIDTVEMTNAKAVYHYYNENTNEADKGYVNNFKLPTRIDCANVIPNSVREYEYFYNNDKITTDVVSSWTDAFSKKTQFINTAIDTINTDIQVDRSKIDSFDSICSTFRSRAHEAHSNTAANVR